MSDEALVPVETFRFLPEAEAVMAYLEAAGLTVTLAGGNEAVLDPVLGSAQPNTALLVPSAQAEKAFELLEQWAAKREEKAEEEMAEEETEDEEQSEATTCLACGTAMPEGISRCPACGWSYGQEPPGSGE